MTDNPPRTVLAALDASATARAVLDTALRIGSLTGASVHAVHVADARGPEMLDDLTAQRQVPLRRLSGAVHSVLLEAAEAPDVVAVVVGARATAGGRRPVGRVARHVLEQATKPVVVVPPDAVSEGPVRRLLVPLEGTASSSRPVLDVLCPLLAEDIELVVLHVFTERTIPRMLDRPLRDLELLGKEFLAEHFPRGTRIELRPGPVASRVVESSKAHGADLVVLSWSQDSSPGRAEVVREVLGASDLPVLLLPVRADGATAEPVTATSAGHSSS